MACHDFVGRSVPCPGQPGSENLPPGWYVGDGRKAYLQLTKDKRGYIGRYDCTDKGQAWCRTVAQAVIALVLAYIAGSPDVGSIVVEGVEIAGVELSAHISLGDAKEWLLRQFCPPCDKGDPPPGPPGPPGPGDGGGGKPHLPWFPGRPGVPKGEYPRRLPEGWLVGGLGLFALLASLASLFLSRKRG